jgi:hypothetical protein
VLYSLWYHHTETSEWSKITKIIKIIKIQVVMGVVTSLCTVPVTFVRFQTSLNFRDRLY